MAAQVWQGENGTASQCDELLRAHVPAAGQADLREFCWRYQWGLLRRVPDQRLPPGLRVFGVADDDQVVTLDIKGVVTSWTLDGRREPKSLTLTARSVAGISLSRTGEVAALIDSDGSPRMYTARTGVQKGSFPAQSGPLTSNT